MTAIISSSSGRSALAHRSIGMRSAGLPCPHSRRRALCVRASAGESPAPGPAPSSPPAAPAPASSPDLELPAGGLTTWKYGSLKEPGLAAWYVAAAFMPFVLLLVPLLSSPPMPPVTPPPGL